MTTILEKIGNLKAANKADKILMLRQYLKDPQFRKFLTLCCDTSLTYKVSRVKETEPMEGDVFEFLEFLAEAKSIKASHKSELAALASQTPETLEIVNKILRHNMDCGIDAKTINQAIPGIVPYYPYMRCSGAEKLDVIQYPAFSQLKCDGMFMNVIVSNLDVTFTTRNGKSANFLKVLDELAQLPPGVYMGEALVVIDGKIQPRAQGNAIITKALSENISKEECEQIVFEFWDVVSLEGFANGIEKVPYRERMKKLAEAFGSYTPVGTPKARLLPTKFVFSKEDAFDHYYFIRETDGLEGTVVKDQIGYWEDGTSALQVKMKAVKECEVEIVGWEPGKPGGKYENVIGAFLVESSCGKLKAKVSGMDDSVREDDPEKYMRKILTVKFNAVSKHNSFDHARFVEIRDDKDVADTLEYILKLKG